ncbi:KH domain-containing, RNA-binding, signal transduction-associated protein 2-like [Ornithodoros turicata]|uniref:KH domain-containing, RNA-binding, signal transduction-associated protein 2-like n=1 Tax=Ornithodoros turicata TaxID=34597 RepID=UPI0031399E2B
MAGGGGVLVSSVSQQRLNGSGDKQTGLSGDPCEGVVDSGAAYLLELLAEREKVSGHAARLLDQEIHRLQIGSKAQTTLSVPSPLLDIHKGRCIRLQVRILVPVKDHPNFNFVGKLLGPKGNSLKRLQEETQTKMAILGRGSMRDKGKEEELRQLREPKYAHLQEELHVEVTTFAPPAEAYGRMGNAIAQLKPFLVPDYYDEIRQTQLRELAILNGDKKNKSKSNVDGAMSPGEPPHQASVSVAAQVANGMSTSPLPRPSPQVTRAATFMIPGGRMIPSGVRLSTREGAVRLRPAASLPPMRRCATLPVHRTATGIETIATSAEGEEFLYGDEYPECPANSVYDPDYATVEEHEFSHHQQDNIQSNGYATEGEFLEWSSSPLRSPQISSRLKSNRIVTRHLYRPYGPCPARF